MMKEQDIQIAREALALALSKGAQKARVTLNVSTEDLVATLNGEIDRVNSCNDRSLTLSLFVDGRYGAFSTNRLDTPSLEAFVERSVDIARALQADACRDLPAPEHCCKTALKGDEMGALDEAYFDVTSQDRIRKALEASVFDTDPCIISEEGEYSDSIFETLVIDSQGLFCRHSETGFDYGVEMTIRDGDEKYSGFWWDSACRKDELDARACALKALEKAKARVGADVVPGRKCTMVVDSEAASKFVSPVLTALSAYSIQQNNSFLTESLGKKLFSGSMTLVDNPWIKGNSCSKLFDSEGVATGPMDIIRDGKVCNYFTNTYMAAKTGFAPTVEEATRPQLLPWPEKGMDRDAILRLCGDGIYVTDFNGGNSNSTTGDFSYGIEGFEFKDGRITRPVSGMLVTGNLISLWQNLVAVGDDARECLSKLIPTLAFSNVDINGE